MIKILIKLVQFLDNFIKYNFIFSLVPVLMIPVLVAELCVTEASHDGMCLHVDLSASVVVDVFLA